MEILTTEGSISVKELARQMTDLLAANFEKRLQEKQGWHRPSTMAIATDPSDLHEAPHIDGE